MSSDSQFATSRVIAALTVEMDSDARQRAAHQLREMATVAGTMTIDGEFFVTMANALDRFNAETH